ncbi:MAG: hypothetical protein ACR2OZ_12780 [Verrucomicrobiales bacterium]
MEFKNSPGDAQWTPLGNDIVADAETAVASDVTASPRRFYRIRRLD